MVSTTKLQSTNFNLKAIAAGVTLTLTLGGLGILGEAAQAQQGKSTRSVASIANGTFLYGQNSQPNKLRNEYVVFSHQNGAVVGAVYYPRSEYACFTGSLENKTIDVKSGSADKSKNTVAKIELSNLHQVGSISPNDQRILSTCKRATVALVNP